MGAVRGFHGDRFALSNLYPCPVLLGGHFYVSAWNAYFDRKGPRLLGKEEVRALLIEEAGRPDTARMQQVLAGKLAMNPGVALLLRNTQGSSIQAEGNDLDATWGPPRNLLGQALEEARRSLPSSGRTRKR